MSIDPPEPTEEDYCHMYGHPLAFTEEDTDWESCYCGRVTAPPYDEPHDEYSAVVANLCDEYVSTVHAACNGSQNVDIYATYHHAYFTLMRKDIPFLKKLIESARNSAPEHLGKKESISFETAVLLGVHLDYSGVSAVRAACNSVDGETVLISFYADLLPDAIDTPKRLPVARTAAKLYSMLRMESMTRHDSYNWSRTASDFVAEAAPMLTECPDRIPEIAAMFNSHPNHESAIRLTKAILEGSLDSPSAPLMDGLL